MLKAIRSRRSERGAELLEFAFVLPLMMLTFAAIVDFGLLFQRYLVVANAAREGARIAVLPQYSGNTANVKDRVTAYMQEGLGDAALDCPIGGTGTCSTDVQAISVDMPGTAPSVPARQVTVNFTSNYLVLGPVSNLFYGGGSAFGAITLRARSTMRLE